jgi:uncharacterized protein YcnI
MLRRLLLATAVATGALLVLAGPAAAHVTVSSPSAEQGGFATLTFQVPNEEADAGTNRLEVTLPEDHPLPFVSVQPVPGWTATLERTALDEPVEVEGEELTEAVSRITWEGGPIQPGQFQQFLVSAGPLPEDVEQLEFPAVQTYDNGEVSRWIEPPPEGGEEPEFPAPVLELAPPSEDEGGGGGDAQPTDGTETTAATAEAGNDQAAAISDVSDDADQARTLGIIGIVVGALGLLAALATLFVRRQDTANARR